MKKYWKTIFENLSPSSLFSNVVTGGHPGLDLAAERLWLHDQHLKFSLHDQSFKTTSNFENWRCEWISSAPPSNRLQAGGERSTCSTLGTSWNMFQDWEIARSTCSTCTVGSSPPPLWKGDCTDPSWPRTDRSPGRGLLLWKNVRVLHLHMWGIMANMVLCVIPGQGNSKILNLVKSGSFDSPIFLYIPNDEKTSTGHLIWPQPFIWQPFLEISCPGMTLWI